MIESSYRRVSAVMVAAGIAGTVTNVSVTVVTSALTREWGVPLGTVAVAVLAINVSMALVMPIAGLVAGRYGMRAVLLAGGCVLGASSVLLLFAQDVVMLAIGRLGQGAGLAAITPTAVQASSNLLHGPQHARALGWWSAANGAGLAVGPVLGGALFDLGEWKLVPLPTILIALFVVASTIVGVPKGLRHEGSVRLHGALVLSLGAGLAVAFLSAVSIRAWSAAVATAVLLSGLVAYSLMGSRRVELPLGWFQDFMVRRSGTGASVQMFVNGMAQVGVPAWLVTESITSSGGAGAILLAMTLTMTIMGPFTGRRSDISYPRWFRAGAILCAAGMAALALGASGAPKWLVLPALVVTGLGAGSLLTPSFQAFSETIPGKDGVGLAVYNLLRLSSFAIGGILGAAAVDARSPGVGFVATAVVCLLLLTRSFPHVAVAPAR
jgi:MFS transporter, DHA2 family, methylenomycin A resistance protein